MEKIRFWLSIGFWGAIILLGVGLAVKSQTAEADTRPAGFVVPSGAVMFWPTTAGPIPDEWAEYEPARGRVLVGLPLDARGIIGGQATHSHVLSDTVRADYCFQKPTQSMQSGTGAGMLTGVTGEASNMPPYLAGFWIVKK